MQTDSGLPSFSGIAGVCSFCAGALSVSRESATDMVSADAASGIGFATTEKLLAIRVLAVLISTRFIICLCGCTPRAFVIRAAVLG